MVIIYQIHEIASLFSIANIKLLRHIILANKRDSSYRSSVQLDSVTFFVMTKTCQSYLVFCLCQSISHATNISLQRILVIVSRLALEVDFLMYSHSQTFSTQKTLSEENKFGITFSKAMFIDESFCPRGQTVYTFLLLVFCRDLDSRRFHPNLYR